MIIDSTGEQRQAILPKAPFTSSLGLTQLCSPSPALRSLLTGIRRVVDSTILGAVLECAR